MPKIKTEQERLLEAQMAALEEFAAGFKRSKKGNLWRTWEGQTLCVFRRTGDDYFGWSISDAEGPRYSPGGYEDEGDALSALTSELSIGEW